MIVAEQLPEILIRNSFNILGLSSSSALKEIRKRSQQILQLAKIEEIQGFDIDIGHVKEFRNEGEIRLAVERVSGIQDRLKEIFFWFEDHRIESLKALEFISKGSYQKAIAIFEASGSDWLDKKNLALTLMFHAFTSSSMSDFCRSLDIWKLITNSDDFWKFYEKHYLLHDELGTSTSLFEEFRGSLFEMLSVKAVSFYHQTKNPEAIGVFYSKFGQIGKIVDFEILQPIILKIKNEMEALIKIDLEFEVDITLLRRILKKIQKGIDELDKFELSEYSPLIVLKNDIAEKLRSISVNIYNQNSDSEIAYIFLDQSFKIAASESVADKIASDKKQLKENEAWKSVSSKFEKIELLIADQKIEESKIAFLKLDNEIAGKANDSSDSRVQVLINYCLLLMPIGQELFGKKRFGIEILAISGFLNRKSQKSGVLIFEYVFEILKDRLHLLDFISPESDKAALLKNMEVIGRNLEKCELSDLFDYHKSYLQTTDEIAYQQANENTQIAIKLLGAAVCFAVLYRRYHGVSQWKMWKWIGCMTAIALYFFVIVDDDKPKPNSTYKTNYQEKVSYSSQALTYEEKNIIEYLQKNEQETLKNARKAGYSDKQIARYVIEHANDEEE